MSAALPDLTPEAELLDAARAHGVVFHGVQPGLLTPRAFIAPSLLWNDLAATSPSYGATVATPVDISAAGLLARIAETRAAFAA